MPYNLLLIPILAGYFILTNSYFLKYNYQRFTRTRILYESLLLAVIIIAVGFFIRTLISVVFPQLIPWTLEFLEVMPVDKPIYFWTFVFSSLVAICISLVLNKVISKFYHKNDPIVWAVNKHGDELEKLFKNSSENGTTIQVTLKNNKVYIGFCEETPIPSKTNYISISPILSGYRDSETKQLKITTNYFNVVNEFMKDIEESEETELSEITLNTDVIIKQDEILTAGIYEQEIFDKFNNTAE